MAKIMTEYDLLVSCPGDVDGVVELVKQVVAQFNETYSAVLAVRLNVRHWSKDSYNQSGGKAQELLNKQFIHDCDAAIAVFWTRFGSPTDRYGSGTEEEIEDMLASGKQVFLYFCEKPIKPELLLNKNAKAQYKKVKAYQQGYAEGKGIYAAYSSDDEFKKKLFAHLSMHFLSLKREAEIATKHTSELRLAGIDAGKIDDCFRVEKYQYSGERTVDGWRDEIRRLYGLILSCRVTPPTANNTLSIYSVNWNRRKVELPDNMLDTIRLVAENMEIDLPEDALSLGGLQEDTIPALLGGGSLYGTEDEKKKYRTLVKLYENIEGFCEWRVFCDSYYGLKCIKLAVINSGKAFDEDIDITLLFPSGAVINPHDLPIMEDSVCRCIVEDYSAEELFGIKATQHFGDYESSRRGLQGREQPQPRILPSDIFESQRDYIEEYRDAIDFVFDYGFFEDSEGSVVKLHVDYLKHNTSVAFPTVLFVSDEIKEIKYTIRSKHNAEEVKGVIRVKTVD